MYTIMDIKLRNLDIQVESLKALETHLLEAKQELLVIPVWWYHAERIVELQEKLNDTINLNKVALQQLYEARAECFRDLNEF